MHAGARQHADDVACLDRSGEQIALAGAAAHLHESARLAFGLHALRGDVYAQGVRQGQDGTDDRCVVGVLLNAAYEAAIYLERVHREALQVGERGVAGAEVVDSDANPELLETKDGELAGRSIRHSDALSDLQLKHVGGRAGFPQDALDRGHEVWVDELPRREIHTHDQGAVRAVSAPRLRLAAGLVQYPI